MKLTLDYPPLGNRFYRNWRGRMVMSPEGRHYKATVALLGLQAQAQPYTGPVSVAITAYRPRKAGDVDSILKVLLDSLEGVAYTNDRQIVTLLVERRDDKARPRVEVTVRELHEL